MPVARRAARPNVGQDVGPADLTLARAQLLVGAAPPVGCLSEATNRRLWRAAATTPLRNTAALVATSGGLGGLSFRLARNDFRRTRVITTVIT
jgi:hypothetical protein